MKWYSFLCLSLFLNHSVAAQSFYSHKLSDKHFANIEVSFKIVDSCYISEENKSHSLNIHCFSAPYKIEEVLYLDSSQNSQRVTTIYF